ncbi:TrbC/VirB2 family protein [Aggregatibacter actinomycetemcomitans]|uniref:TrbC/VirB2 family protein n=1 Tax=Aggregatibacter actinomycetemcomitans TaxID=714 RepID=UPI0030CA3A2A
MSSSGVAEGKYPLVDNILNSLTYIQIGVVTIAVIVAGYKVLFQGQTFREVAPILVGGIIIGAAAEIAKLLVG